jgi:hypothetical protein
VFSACGTGNPTYQTFVNIFAHEGIWGNVGGNSDNNGTPYGDIANKVAFPFSPYTVSASSYSTLRGEFGF